MEEKPNVSTSIKKRPSKNPVKNRKCKMASAQLKRLNTAQEKHKIFSAHNANHEKNFQKQTLVSCARQKLESAHFRYLNEKLYTTDSSEAWKLFQEDPHAFEIYHKGFQNQVAKWPINPLELIISDILKQAKTIIVADFGCGEAQLSKELPNKVYSFDLVAANDTVIACDMASVPLGTAVVDVVVFCLSLMGSNTQDFLKEASRVLKIGGVLYIAEVESRCQNVQVFLKKVEKFGFKLRENDTQQYFFLAKFNKVQNLTSKATLPQLNLKPCLYKRR